MPRVPTRPAPAVAATHDSPTLRTRHDRQARAHARALKKNRASRGHTTRADDYDLVPIINVSSCPSSTCSLPRFGGSLARFGVLAPLRRPIARICTALAELPSLGERCMCVCIKYCTRFCPRIRALPPIIMHAIYELLARLPRAHAHRLLTTDCPSPPVSAVVARTNANTTAGRLPPPPSTPPRCSSACLLAPPHEFAIASDHAVPRARSASHAPTAADVRHPHPIRSNPFLRRTRSVPAIPSAINRGIDPKMFLKWKL